MSFICQFCGKSPPAGVGSKKIVTAYREHHHPPRPRALQRKVEKNGKKKKEWIMDPGGFGLQIAREVLACPGCAAGWEQQCKIYNRVVIEKAVKIEPPRREITPEQRRPPFRSGPRKFDGPRPPRTNNNARKPFPRAAPPLT